MIFPRVAVAAKKEEGRRGSEKGRGEDARGGSEEEDSARLEFQAQDRKGRSEQQCARTEKPEYKEKGGGGGGSKKREMKACHPRREEKRRWDFVRTGDRIFHFFNLLTRCIFVPVRKPHIIGVHDIGTYCDIRYNETRPAVIVTKNFSLSLTRRRRPKHYSLRGRRVIVSDHNNNKKTRTMPPPLSSEHSTKRAFTKRVSEMKGKKKSGRERKVVKMEEEKRKGDLSIASSAGRNRRTRSRFVFPPPLPPPTLQD